jgi:hypothetical protein
MAFVAFPALSVIGAALVTLARQPRLQRRARSPQKRVVMRMALGGSTLRPVGIVRAAGFYRADRDLMDQKRLFFPPRVS